MFGRIRKIFSDSAVQTGDNEAVLHLAAAILLIEVAKSDDSLVEDELQRLRVILQHDWRLDESELDGLLAFARDASDAGESLQQHIDLINRNFSSARKLDLVRNLWQAAAADGQIHHQEELLIHRLADLLNFPEDELIRCKHWVLG